jgi:transposase-like protein
MLAIHPNARTTPAVRAEIARSAEPTGELARRYGVSTETVRKWRRRGAPTAGTAPAVPQAALEGERGGARRGLRAAPRHRLPAR